MGTGRSAKNGDSVPPLCVPRARARSDGLLGTPDSGQQTRGRVGPTFADSRSIHPNIVRFARARAKQGRVYPSNRAKCVRSAPESSVTPPGWFGCTRPFGQSRCRAMTRQARVRAVCVFSRAEIFGKLELLLRRLVPARMRHQSPRAG